MADDTPTEDAGNRPYLRLRAAVAGAVGLGFLAVSLLGGAGVDAAGGDEPVRATESSAADDRAEAIARWLAETDPVPTTPYTGTCADSGSVGMLCSSRHEALGDEEIHVVGLHATDAGMDVLLERADGRWTVVDAAPWPDLGAPHAGPPWSPTTAITAWWSERATDVYGSPDAVHLPTCADGDGLAAAGGQTLLCSTLVEDVDGTRVYDSGRVGAPADVRITVVRQPDRTWAVTDTLAR